MDLTWGKRKNIIKFGYMLEGINHLSEYLSPLTFISQTGGRFMHDETWKKCENFQKRQCPVKHFHSKAHEL